ncbi:hypothetical protein DM02DRAFT_654419 [Periconia macrospinosa]|uniref:Uncharacterized protein n=1 Tax=Periconia macrospinosa TaxID=97972 RepID=A0A2V1DTS1_9PLEO|nr:hypothetical protein DM02DRAFT_654419 [Periconia macrospinosa]
MKDMEDVADILEYQEVKDHTRDNQERYQIQSWGQRWFAPIHRPPRNPRSTRQTQKYIGHEPLYKHKRAFKRSHVRSVTEMTGFDELQDFALKYINLCLSPPDYDIQLLQHSTFQLLDSNNLYFSTLRNPNGSAARGARRSITTSRNCAVLAGITNATTVQLFPSLNQTHTGLTLTESTEPPPPAAALPGPSSLDDNNDDVRINLSAGRRVGPSASCSTGRRRRPARARCYEHVNSAAGNDEEPWVNLAWGCCGGEDYCGTWNYNSSECFHCHHPYCDNCTIMPRHTPPSRD